MRAMAERLRLGLAALGRQGWTMVDDQARRRHSDSTRSRWPLDRTARPREYAKIARYLLGDHPCSRQMGAC